MSQFSGHPLRDQKCWRSHTWCCQKWRRKFVTICSSLASFCWKNINHDCPNRSLNCRKDVCTVWRLYCSYGRFYLYFLHCWVCLVGWNCEFCHYFGKFSQKCDGCTVWSVQWGYLSVLGGYLVHPDPECADWRKSFSEAVFFWEHPPPRRFLPDLGGSSGTLEAQIKPTMLIWSFQSFLKTP